MMTLRSSSFEDGGEIPQKHGKRQDNLSPHLAWAGAPTGTRSFALTVFDTHPVARGYVHWLVIGIEANTDELAQGAAARGMPSGSQQVEPYAGPFPPSGTHEYEFTVYALDTDLIEPPPSRSLQGFLDALAPHTLDRATLVGTFTRVG